MRKLLCLLMAVGMAISMNAQTKAADPNVSVGQAIKNIGLISMSVGAPCVAAGLASILYANLLPNPTAGYTTSQTLANEDPNLQYMSASEYIGKLEEYNGKVRAANTAGYLLVGSGAALTIVGIPLYCYGKKMMLNVNYTGNGAGLALNF